MGQAKSKQEKGAKAQSPIKKLMAERGWIRRPPVFAPRGFKAKWVEGLSNEQYHAQHTAISSTQLKYLLDSPKAWEWLILKQPKKPDTPALRFGKLFHMAMLEPELFRDKVVIRRTAPKGELVQEDRVPISEDDYAAIGHMLESCHKNALVEKLLGEGRRELSGFFTDPRTGIACRLRPDLIWNTQDWIIDFKTVREASLRHFRRDIEDFRYDVSGAMYCAGASEIEGRTFDKFIWIVVQKVPPYEVLTIPMSAKYHETGTWGYHTAMDRLKLCLETLKFPGHSDEAINLEPSVWFYESYLAEENAETERAAYEHDQYEPREGRQ